MEIRKCYLCGNSRLDYGYDYDWTKRLICMTCSDSMERCQGCGYMCDELKENDEGSMVCPDCFAD